MKSCYRCWALILIASSILALESNAQDSPLAQNNPAELIATTDFAGRWVEQRDVLSIRLNRYLQPADGAIAIFFGHTDMTSLFSLRHVTFTYRPGIFPLPIGETEVIVYLISRDNLWLEIARFTLKVLTGAGFEKFSLTPTLDLNNKGQIAENSKPEINQPPRPTYQDYSGQFNFSGELLRNDFAVGTQFNVVGVSYRNEAIRYGDKGKDAPKIDLSSYVVQMKKGKMNFSVGHVSHGSHRHLINFYGSRGTQLSGAIGSAIDFSAAAMNGTNLVGWDNFLGLDNRRHRIYSGMFGLEFFTHRPGALRLETSFMDGSLLPRNPYNRGNINEAEKSRGLGIRVLTGTVSQRLRFEGGFARSRFTNPNDPFLTGGSDIVPVRETTRNALYLDTGVGVLQNLSLGKNWRTSLDLGYHHERVDPLYRTTATYVRSDFMEHAIDVQWNLRALSARYSIGRSEDNLDDVPSILKTKTKRGAVNVGLPLGAFLGVTSQWLPMLSYGHDRTHQLGVALPQNAGFSPGHVPDQLSLSHMGSVDWQFNRWRIGYRLAYSQQDNRQAGRERSDFANTSHALAFIIRPLTMLDLNFDAGLEDAESKEIDRTDRTQRYGVNAALQISKNSAFNVNLATTTTKDDGNTAKRTNSFVNLEWSLRFSLSRRSIRRWRGQFFVRYAWQENSVEDNFFFFNSDGKNWTVNTGVSFSIL